MSFSSKSAKVLKRINSYIVGCKLPRGPAATAAKNRINSYIVGCKFLHVFFKLLKPFMN